MPSFEPAGNAFDSAKMESFWGSVQVRLLNRKRRNTQVELTNAIFKYFEIFDNRQCRHSELD